MSPRHKQVRHYLGQGLYDRLSSFRELEERICALPTAQDRENAFEVFSEAFLATQRMLQAEEIWGKDTIPPAVSKELSLGEGQRVGVDGFYRVKTGGYHAYQVSFRTGRTPLPFNDVAPLLVFQGRVVSGVLITNSDDLPPQINHCRTLFCIRGVDLDRLEAADFEAIRGWLAGQSMPLPRKVPRPHQQEALNALLPALREGSRATAVMACGTGKTLVALWVAEQLDVKRVLVLVPSLALIRQTLHEWIRETRWQDVGFLCVCSDPTVKHGVDEIVTHAADLDFPVSTDAKTVAQFLSGKGPAVRVIVSTYQSAKVVGKGTPEGQPFDLAILDEAHKTAGPEGRKFAFALSDKNLPIAKRLFLTATPRHSSTTKRTKDGEQAILFSMDDPATYGPTTYTLGFAEAARRRIICDCTVIISVITSASLNDELLRQGIVKVENDTVRARQVANQVALEKAVSQFGVHHISSFHSNVASARSFTTEGAEGIGSIIPGIATGHVNGTMRTSDREAIIKTFREAPLAIVSNARCLTEGVDLPAVDLVAFMSPKRSKIDIVQAAGRAMRIPRDRPDKQTGYIFLPLYVEQTEGESEVEALQRNGMEEIVDVVNEMKEQDTVLAHIIAAAQEERGKTGRFDESRFRDCIEIVGPPVSVTRLRSAITTAAIGACRLDLGSTLW